MKLAPPSPVRLSVVGGFALISLTAGCSTLSGPSGPSATVDIIGLPRPTDSGAITNRNRILQRTPPPSTPPAPTAPAPSATPTTGP